MADHQVAALLLTKRTGLVYKIPDAGYGQKPFDCFFLKGQAYVVVMFWKPGQKEFFMIDIDEFVKLREETGRPSLTVEDAQRVGSQYAIGQP